MWHAILRAWEADNASGAGTRHLERLGCLDAFPEEVALYVQFKSAGSDKAWNELIRRAALSDRRATLADRRTARVDTSIDRRRAASRA